MYFPFNTFLSRKVFMTSRFVCPSMLVNTLRMPRNRYMLFQTYYSMLFPIENAVHNTDSLYTGIIKIIPTQYGLRVKICLGLCLLAIKKSIRFSFAHKYFYYRKSINNINILLTGFYKIIQIHLWVEMPETTFLVTNFFNVSKVNVVNGGYAVCKQYTR